MSFKEVLDSRGLTRYAFEKMTGMQTLTVHRLYTGEARIENVSLGIAAKMAKALGFDTIDTFLEEARNPVKKLYVLKNVYVRTKDLEHWQDEPDQKPMAIYTLLQDALDEMAKHDNNETVTMKRSKRHVIWAVQEGWYDEPMIEDIPDGLVTEEESKLLSKAFVEGGEWYSDFKAD